MTDPAVANTDKTLSTTKKKQTLDLGYAIIAAARESGRSLPWLTLDLIRHAVGQKKLPPLDYLRFGLYRPDRTREEREAFVSEVEISRLNKALRPPDDRSLAGVINSKLTTELVLRGAGFPTSTTIAMARPTPARLPFPVLTDAEAIVAFLSAPGRLPVFGKPDTSSLGIGAASLIRLEGEDVVLGDGTRTPLRRLAAEIIRDYPEGFVFQELLVPHPDLQRLIGPIVGTLRVLTLKQRGGPRPLFVMLKMPGPNAMVDGALSGSNAVGFVDPQSGRILRAQLLTDPLGQDLTHNHVTGAPLTGEPMPGFAEAVGLAVDVHRLFIQLGVLGSDIILTDRGPVINEINLNPLSFLVQNARGSGLFDETFKARYREALAMQGVALPVKGVRL